MERLCALFALCVALAGCRGTPAPDAPVDAGFDAGPGGPPSAIHATQWPEADALFHQDPSWLGADAAYSVPLGNDRVLWLFGDTFIATSAKHVRSESRMPRNTVGIQTGLDPTVASMAFAWRDDGTGPSSFFAEEGTDWFWPQHGIRVGNTLVIFLSRVRATPGQGLGFEGAGWRAVVVSNPDDPPLQWQMSPVDPTGGPAGIDLAAGLTRVGDEVFGLAVSEDPSHTGYLVRWHAADLERGDVLAFEWWNGSAFSATDAPVPILDDAGPESSLHFDASLGTFVHTWSRGFGASTISVQFSYDITGPWLPARDVYRPPEDARPNPFVYAAKGHPELAGADLVVTYASNSFDFSELVNDTSLYYPRFVKLNWTR